MDEIINEYGQTKIEEINAEPLMLPEYKAKTIEIINNVMDAYTDGYITANEAMRKIANAEQSAAKILNGKNRRRKNGNF